ncbi:DUF6481 family protein [Pararoseomonas indoligenes]|uniref:Uncharacterized protein n=1 Tax=Roseomonas indoligenes TaxID=2820811 RepID=A0A940N0E9_9PROT|nr:DUF6481 family protein [Pararoseomonas indoligenes]MBP0494400.1 hypothetical protein [Pararoseomonas indoligenes]
MRTLKGTDFNDRSKNSLEAKKALLERFKSRPTAAEDPAVAARQEERRQIIQAREAREAERRRLKEEEKARQEAERLRLIAEEEARQAELAREAAEATERARQELIEAKLERDRRYAARKARAKGKK